MSCATCAWGKSREAIPLFEEVIRRDPAFAPAQAALAATYGDLTMSWPNPEGYALAPAEATARMASLTETALELDPMLAEAHVAKAYMHALARRWVDAEASFRHALRLDPTITAVYGDFVLSTLEPWGRLDEALLWRQWKTPRRRRAALLALGVGPLLASKTAGSGLGPWYLARAKALSVGLSNAYFKSLGLPTLTDGW